MINENESCFLSKLKGTPLVLESFSFELFLVGLSIGSPTISTHLID